MAKGHEGQPPPAADWGPTVVRVIVGFMFFMYGWDKFFELGLDFWEGLFDAQGIPAPRFAAVMIALLELLGGVALVVGFLTREVAALLTIDMIVAILVVGLDGGFYVWDNGVSFPLALLAGTLALVLMGSGEAAVDRVSGWSPIESALGSITSPRGNRTPY